MASSEGLPCQRPEDITSPYWSSAPAHGLSQPCCCPAVWPFDPVADPYLQADFLLCLNVYGQILFLWSISSVQTVQATEVWLTFDFLLWVNLHSCSVSWVLKEAVWPQPCCCRILPVGFKPILIRVSHQNSFCTMEELLANPAALLQVLTHRN